MVGRSVWPPARAWRPRSWRAAAPARTRTGGDIECVHLVVSLTRPPRGAPAPCGIARHTACGVAGMAMSSWPSALVTALITAGGAAIAPASPQPLMPSGLDGHGVTVMSTRRTAGRRRAAWCSPCTSRSRAGRPRRRPRLEQRLADALRDAAMDLALDDHRIDDGAEIVDRTQRSIRRDAGVGIDLDLADVDSRPGR
jgi:hypothetical protein